MPSLRKDLRDKLEKTVFDARVAAEAGAREALAALGVDQGKSFEHLKPAEKALRNQLRARGRQAGDVLDDRSAKQTIDHLVQMVGYEHWHRMLFARFLAENGLLLEPDHQVAVSLADVDELARDAKVDIWELAGRFAQRMLPAVFRADDPVLALTLARETRTKLEKMVGDLPKEVFLADDSLGWTYQFWQAQRKAEVNKSEVAKGADELSPVTQLFTEDYMVEFLLHNTLGAWWAGKLGPIKAASEDAVRGQAKLPAKNGLPEITWTYLRFVKDEATQTWTPAAGTFPDWPKDAKKITFLDPCMGSGHFLVFVVPILARLRMEEEGLNAAAAVTSVLHDNIHGLELDERCTQIAAFNVALTAWKLAGYQPLPALHLACSGVAPNVSEAVWVALAGADLTAQNGMAQLYRLFKNAPVLGSLLNPRTIQDELLDAKFHQLEPLLEKALAQEKNDDTAHEMAVTARGLAKAAEILAGQFILVATNVPYLGRAEQCELLQDWSKNNSRHGKGDLATTFLDRVFSFGGRSGHTMAVVSPHEWWFLKTWTKFRDQWLTEATWRLAATLGEEAWESFGIRGPKATLTILDSCAPGKSHSLGIIDALPLPSIPEKIREIRDGRIVWSSQEGQRNNPDHRVTTDGHATGRLLSEFAVALQGVSTADIPRFVRCFWEHPFLKPRWDYFQGSISETCDYGGRESVVDMGTLIAEGDKLGAAIRGRSGWGKIGIAIRQLRSLYCSIYSGNVFDTNVAVIVPKDDKMLLSILAFCSSPEFTEAVRRIDKKKNVTNGTMVKVPFEEAHWESVAAEKYPHGLPKPFSNDPTQWLFNGHPFGSTQPLQVAVARLLGFRWPRQTNSNFPDCPILGSDGLEEFADGDGIVCLSAVRGERTASDRLQTLLSASFEKYDESGLILGTGSKAKSLDDWLRDDFFAQHCGLFLACPFIWHIWDGRSDGFHALVNYHKLAAPDGAGRKLLESLVFAYLGDWIKKQRNEIKKPGAEERLIAAEALQRELRAILVGEPPYDIFVRWKPLHRQSIGWEPDINDGFRLNIRPFLLANDVARKGAGVLRTKPGSSLHWKKDRGTEPHRAKVEFPWLWGWDEKTEDFTGGPNFDGNRWNDCHYTTAAKRAARERINTPKE